MSLLTLLSRRLGVLLGGGRVLFALRVITFSMLFGRCPMRFGRIFVMLSSLIVFMGITRADGPAGAASPPTSWTTFHS